jgi:hypothetical protein
MLTFCSIHSAGANHQADLQADHDGQLKERNAAEIDTLVLKRDNRMTD